MDMTEDMETRNVWFNDKRGGFIQGVVLKVTKKNAKLLNQIDVTFF